jgi:hypothetical protein
MPRAVLRLHAQRGHLKNLRSRGASTVELAIFFTLVAAILGSVTLFLTGTLPQIFAAARLINALEGATLVKPRLGGLFITHPASNHPDLGIAGSSAQEYFALRKEVDALQSLMELAFPGVHAEPLSCVAVYRVKDHYVLSSADSLYRTGGSLCPDARMNPCIIAQAEAILEAKGCSHNDVGSVILAALFPRESGLLKSPCAVSEIGYPRSPIIPAG